MRRSNCLLYALRRWWTHGGFFIVTKSRYGWWCHFLWSQDLVVFESFDPKGPKRRRRMFPVLFSGRVVSWRPRAPSDG